MRTHLITYDLNSPGQNYSRVITAIKSCGSWCRIASSTYEVKTFDTVTTVRDKVSRVMDTNDTLFVVEVTDRAAAWYGLPTDVGSWLRAA